MVDEHRPVAAFPVERDQPVLADVLLNRERAEVFVRVESELLRLGQVFGRQEVVGEPAEDVADAALAGLVSPKTLHDAVGDHAAHAGHLGKAFAVHDMARRGAHDREHLAGQRRLRRRPGDVRVDVADGDGDAFGQAGPARGLGGQAARPAAEGRQRKRELVLRRSRRSLG